MEQKIAIQETATCRKVKGVCISNTNGGKKIVEGLKKLEEEE
jgi:hypothetical protein